MSSHTGYAKRLGYSLVLVWCSLEGVASAEAAIATAPEVVAYCAGRTVALPQGERDIAAAGCRILAAGAAESLAHHDLASAIEQLRALDERMKQRVAPPAPVVCAAPPACPSPSPPRPCPTAETALLAPRPPRPPGPIASPTRVRHHGEDLGDPFEDASRPPSVRSAAKAAPISPATAVKHTTPSPPKKHRAEGRDLMDPFPHNASSSEATVPF